jgi:hypothetical protein
MTFRHGNAGDIAGAPAMVPPEVLGDITYLISNDFFGRGGKSDDYRTQQLGLDLNIASHWGFILDHSILTAAENNPVLPGSSGRIDQVSLAVKYEVYRQQAGPDSLRLIEAGAGIRSYGDYGGSRGQNGIHRLINNSVNDSPYVDTETSMATFWLKGDYQKLYPLPLMDDLKTTWRAGFWLGATGLMSTERQWDAALSANAVLGNQTMTFWLGIREDWRENYDLDFVQQATALSEAGTSLTIGLGAGPVLFETAQGLDDKASYGRFIFTSVENEYSTADYPQQADNSILLNLLFPDVELELQYRRALSYRPESLGHPKTWLVFGMHYGQPAYEDSFDVYNAIQQFNIGVEFEWRDQQHYQWAWPYLALLAGQRTEQLKADSGTLAGQESEQVSSPVVEVGAGVRFSLYPQKTWQFLFQAGLVGHYPISSQTITFDQSQLELLQPGLAVNLGFSLNFGF